MNTLLERVAADARHALRVLRRAPGFTLTAIAVLALTIGANTAVFSVVDAVLLRPLPYRDADRIIQVVITHDPSRVRYTLDTSIPKFFAWKANVPVIARLAAYQAADPGVSFQKGSELDHLSALHVSQEYFAVFGVRPLYGRMFNQAEDRPDGPHVAVLSYGFWMRQFGGDRLAVGRVLPLGAVSYEIVGVLPPEFEPEQPVDLYLPLQADPFSLDFANVIRVVGRMHPHVSVERAAQQLSNTAPEFAHKFPRSMGEWEGFSAVTLRDARVGAAKPVLRLLTGAVAFVLLIGCANISVLLLARGYRRRREIATRAALGAQRATLVQQLLIESGLLAAAGGALGLAIGIGVLRVVIRTAVAAFPSVAMRAAAIPLDSHVLWFTAVATIATGLLFGLLPALTASRVDFSSAFRGDGLTSETRTRGGRLQPALVVPGDGLGDGAARWMRFDGADARRAQTRGPRI